MVLFDQVLRKSVCVYTSSLINVELWTSYLSMSIVES